MELKRGTYFDISPLYSVLIVPFMELKLVFVLEDNIQIVVLIVPFMELKRRKRLRRRFRGYSLNRTFYGIETEIHA